MPRRSRVAAHGECLRRFRILRLRRFTELSNIELEPVYFDLFVERRDHAHPLHAAQDLVVVADAGLHEAEDILRLVAAVFVHSEHFGDIRDLTATVVQTLGLHY